MKAAFVILHYLTQNDTQACLDSLLTVLAEPLTDLIVVDNNSQNGSYEYLKDRYQEYPQIHFIHLTENLGFAQGNNAGYHYAKTVLGCDWIILINNDTLMIQPEFLNLLQKQYERAPFDILGPDILTLKGSHQNPKSLQGFDEKTLSDKIRKIERTLFLNKYRIYEVLVLLDHLKKRSLKSELDQSKTKLNSKLSHDHEIIENCVLHGSCLIFSPRFVSTFNGLFSGTFLYLEEEILWHIAQVEHLRLIYDPAIRIRHLEDRATMARHQNPRRKRLFKLRHERNSLRQLQAIQRDPEIYRRDMLAHQDDREGDLNVSN